MLKFIFETLYNVTPAERDHSHTDFNNWQDESAVNGRIRTTCKLCGEFIGYRPVHIKRRSKPASGA